MAFTFFKRSLNSLIGVHVDLVRVMNLAITITPVDFGVIEGLRTLERQEALVAAGKSQTMHSRHLTSHAVDFMAYVNGVGAWDTPLYAQIADAVKTAATRIHVPIAWGGDWVSFKDEDHIELDRKAYPDEPLVA
jgi:peptidoglycan LD-endopeptidase CwlK